MDNREFLSFSFEKEKEREVIKVSLIFFLLLPFSLIGGGKEERRGDK